MVTRDNINQQIKDILIHHNGNIRIADHPQLVKDATSLGISEQNLSQLITSIYNSIDWKVYEVIDERLSTILNNSGGVIGEGDVRLIVEEVKEQVKPENTVSYLIDKVKKLGLEPRDRFPLDWNSFKNAWMTEYAWKKNQDTAVIWLDEKAASLEQMGDISYRKIEETKYAIRNTNALPPLVTLITKNAARNEEYMEIIQGEADLEKRYLRVIYHLNPSLPFRFNGKEYVNITLLLNDACTSAPSFWALVTVFRKNHIHIWVHESGSPEVNKLLTERSELIDLLSFLYKIDSNYPFYLLNTKYDSPLALVEDARSSGKHWHDLANAIDHGTIGVWFKETGHDVVTQQKQIKDYMERSGLFTDEERRKTVVQGMINIINGAAPLPKIECSTTSVLLPALEAGKPFEQVITMKLINEGFVKTSVYLENAVPGITINTISAVFHSQENAFQHDVVLTINPLLLVKDKQYECSLVINSIFEKITIPVAVKTVFPKKAFGITLLKYAFFLALFFGVVRYLFGAIIPGSSDISSDLSYLSFTDPGRFPAAALLILVPFLLLIAGLYYLVVIIKKAEKI